MSSSILIVDDNEKLCRILAQDFEEIGYAASYALSSAQALDALGRGGVDLAILDLRIGAESGIDLLREIRGKDPLLPVVMVTAYGSIENAVEAVKLGAFDYVQKPVIFSRLVKVVESALAAGRGEAPAPRARRAREGGRVEIRTTSPRMLKLIAKLERLATTDYPVLLTGESGTGKELLADLVHARSRRSAAPILRLNCAALPGSLLDNELFGHDKGAFTGADSVFRGVFERAHRGTLFLDEIGDMPLEIQAKILRVLQNREIRRLGGSETLRVDVRFIAATNKDLGALVASGAFREDLFYRLGSAMFVVPPLRERPEDIVALATEFLGAEDATEDQTCATSLSPEAEAALAAYPWPGNVRELKNTLDFAKAMASGPVIDLDDLPPTISGLALPRGARGPAAAPDPRPNAGSAGPEQSLEAEREAILEALRKAGNNKSLAAEILAVSRRTLYNKLARHGLDGRS